MEMHKKTHLRAHDADLKKLNSSILMTALPAEKIAESFLQYIETYGAFAGRKVINKLIDAYLLLKRKRRSKRCFLKTQKHLVEMEEFM
jgi:hypothetical protein